MSTSIHTRILPRSNYIHVHWGLFLFINLCVTLLNMNNVGVVRVGTNTI